MNKDIYKEYKSIEEELEESDKLEDNIKRLRRNLKEIVGPKGLCESEKKYVEENKIITKRIENIKSFLQYHKKIYK